MSMLGFDAVGRFSLGQIPTAVAPSIGWFSALSEPPRAPRRLNAGEQQFLAFAPLPLVSFSWFEGLAEPVRKLPRSPAAMAPAFFFQPAPSPFVATGWFEALSEPVRFRPGLPAYLQHVFSIDTSVIPLQELIEWFAALSEPVRFKSGLAAARQQFLAAPSQLRPNPTTTAVLDALETKDVFLGGAAVFNPAAAGEIGVIDTTFFAAEIGIVQTTTAGTIASGSISISII